MGRWEENELSEEIVWERRDWIVVLIVVGRGEGKDWGLNIGLSNKEVDGDCDESRFSVIDGYFGVWVDLSFF